MSGIEKEGLSFPEEPKNAVSMVEAKEKRGGHLILPKERILGCSGAYFWCAYSWAFR